MARKADAKGGNGDIIFDLNAGTARKFLRNVSSVDKVNRFEKELTILQEISNLEIANIVQVLSVYINKERVTDSYVEMKKYDGSLYDLFDITKGNVRFSFRLILPIIKALEKLANHTPAIYHRDIKPDNILFLKEGDKYSLYLTDFGTCFLKDGSERITPEIMAIGPRMFIAPEYEIGRVEEIDEKGDIFSIGKVIWCMINGVKDEFLPSNFWFVDEYNLQKSFPDNPEMIAANVIISSCLATNAKDRCDYSSLISQIESLVDNPMIDNEEETKQKVKLYQEKRKMELFEIKEKNRLLVNNFSQCYVKALERLLIEYNEFELFQILYEEYKKKSKDGVDYTSTNVEKNSAHYLYSRTHDRIYISLNYIPARGEEKYCHITISYNISSPILNKSISFFYSDNNLMVCKYNGKTKALSLKTMEEVLNMLLMDYIS